MPGQVVGASGNDDGPSAGEETAPARTGVGPDATGGTVVAAGGTVVRRREDGTIEVAVVHRPLREDWTFPKGKVDPGETEAACARREVTEETGFACRLGDYLGRTEYRDRLDRAKTVSYWLMTRLSGSFAPGDEVDELRWVDLPGAARLLTYERDRDLLARLDALADEELSDVPGRAPDDA